MCLAKPCWIIHEPIAARHGWPDHGARRGERIRIGERCEERNHIVDLGIAPRRSVACLACQWLIDHVDVRPERGR